MEEEGFATNDYKSYYERNFGDKKLHQLVVPHFDPDAYGKHKGDNLSKLELYLKDVAPTTKKLTNAARLRQYHCDHFNIVEDKKHCNFRVGLNEVAADARLKLDLWTAIRNDQLDEAIAKYAAEPVSQIYVESIKIDHPDPIAK